MGIFSKVWKGIKKTVKKIGKGIKKVFGKVATAFGKLGIVGQLGLAVLMPHALSALSGFAGAALGKVGTWSATLLKSSNVFAKAVGYGLKGVHMAGTAIGNMYTSITDTISAGVDKTKEFFGFEPTAKVDLPNKINGDIEFQINKDGTVNFDTSPNDFGASKVDMSAFKEGTIELKAPKTFAEQALSSSATSAVDLVPKSLLEPGVITEVAEKATTNIFQETVADANIFNPDSKIRKDIADFSVYDYAKTTVTGAVDEAFTGGVVAAGQQKVAGALGYKVPNSNETYINLPEMQGAGRNVGKYNEATLWAQENGNNFLTQSFRPRDYVAEAFGNEDSVATYFTKMQKQLFNQNQNNAIFTGSA